MVMHIISILIPAMFVSIHASEDRLFESSLLHVQTQTEEAHGQSPGDVSGPWMGQGAATVGTAPRYRPQVPVAPHTPPYAGARPPVRSPMVHSPYRPAPGQQPAYQQPAAQ